MTSDQQCSPVVRYWRRFLSCEIEFGRCYSEEFGIITLEQQCSPVVRYWWKLFRRAEMEMKIKERYAISTKIEEWRKGSVAAFYGEWGSNGDWS